MEKQSLVFARLLAWGGVIAFCVCLALAGSSLAWTPFQGISAVNNIKLPASHSDGAEKTSIDKTAETESGGLEEIELLGFDSVLNAASETQAKLLLLHASHHWFTRALEPDLRPPWTTFFSSAPTDYSFLK